MVCNFSSVLEPTKFNYSALKRMVLGCNLFLTIMVYSHWKEEALDRIKWRNRFGRGCGPVV
jgi:hypothetical protein